MKRRATRPIQVGTVPIGGDAPIAVQSTATTYTRDVQTAVAQIHRLEEVGCELVRVACPEEVDVDEARLVYPSDGALGPVSLGRTRKSSVPPSFDQQRGTEPSSAKASLRGVPLPPLSQREVP